MGAGAGHGEVKWRIKEGRPARVQGHRRPSRSGDAQKTMVHLLGTGRHIVPPPPVQPPRPPHRDHPDCPTSQTAGRAEERSIYQDCIIISVAHIYIYIYLNELIIAGVKVLLLVLCWFHCLVRTPQIEPFSLFCMNHFDLFLLAAN